MISNSDFEKVSKQHFRFPKARISALFIGTQKAGPPSVAALSVVRCFTVCS
jgi:hypothetical protein